MPRYIDAELIDLSYLLDTICQAQAEEVIDEQPTADVVEVVRCKDCKWFVDEGMYCENNFIPQFNHFFCYYGERREDAEIS